MSSTDTDSSYSSLQLLWHWDPFHISIATLAPFSGHTLTLFHFRSVFTWAHRAHRLREDAPNRFGSEGFSLYRCMFVMTAVFSHESFHYGSTVGCFSAADCRNLHFLLDEHMLVACWDTSKLPLSPEVPAEESSAAFRSPDAFKVYKDQLLFSMRRGHSGSRTLQSFSGL